MDKDAEVEFYVRRKSYGACFGDLRMKLPVCLEPTKEMQEFIICQFKEGYGSARISVQIAVKYAVRVPYSRVKAVLDANGLHRNKVEAHAVMPPCKLEGARSQ